MKLTSISFRLARAIETLLFVANENILFCHPCLYSWNLQAPQSLLDTVSLEPSRRDNEIEFYNYMMHNRFILGLKYRLHSTAVLSKIHENSKSITYAQLRYLCINLGSVNEISLDSW